MTDVEKLNIDSIIARLLEGLFDLFFLFFWYAKSYQSDVLRYEIKPGLKSC
jgi:hypothetical protein